MINSRNKREHIYYFKDSFTKLTNDPDQYHPWCLGPECCDKNTRCAIAPGSSEPKFTKRTGEIHILNPNEYVIVTPDSKNSENKLTKKTYFSRCEEDKRYPKSEVILEKIADQKYIYIMQHDDYTTIFPSTLKR